eukprot:357905-Chlamydomonas_euryale.AAC.1
MLRAGVAGMTCWEGRAPRRAPRMASHKATRKAPCMAPCMASHKAPRKAPRRSNTGQSTRKRGRKLRWGTTVARVRDHTPAMWQVLVPPALEKCSAAAGTINHDAGIDVMHGPGSAGNGNARIDVTHGAGSAYSHTIGTVMWKSKFATTHPHPTPSTLLSIPPEISNEIARTLSSGHIRVASHYAHTRSHLVTPVHTPSHLPTHLLHPITPDHPPCVPHHTCPHPFPTRSLLATQPRLHPVTRTSSSSAATSVSASAPHSEIAPPLPPHVPCSAPNILRATPRPSPPPPPPTASAAAARFAASPPPPQIQARNSRASTERRSSGYADDGGASRSASMTCYGPSE